MVSIQEGSYRINRMDQQMVQYNTCQRNLTTQEPAYIRLAKLALTYTRLTSCNKLDT